VAYVKLDEALVHIIHCPLCKNRCHKQDGVFVCRVCGSSYGQVGIDDGPQNEQIYDFRIHRPACCTPEGVTQWSEIQKHYEAYHQNNITHDPLEMYRQQIESVRDLYTQQFCLTGSVLDVGGASGSATPFFEKRRPRLICRDGPVPRGIQRAREPAQSAPSLPLSEPALQFYRLARRGPAACSGHIRLGSHALGTGSL